VSKTTILIVEDERIVAVDLTRKLERLGFEVAGTATTGEEAVALARSLRPQLVLMDILLEGTMDGIGAADAIHCEHDVPVVYLTAHSDAASIARAKLTGPFGYILKPFEERELSIQIEMALFRYQADRQLREHKEWLRVTLASIGDAVIATDGDGRITFLNPIAESITGWKSEEALGQHITSIFRVINEQTGQPLEEPVTRVLREKRAVALTNHAALVCRKGHTVPIEDTAAPILDAAGQLIGVVLVFHEVTEKRRAEEALRRLNAELEQRVAERTQELVVASRKVQAERQQLNEMLDRMPVYVILITPDYHVPFANRFFEERFGKSNGNRCFEYLFGRTEPCENCETFKVLQTNAPRNWEWLGPDGRNYDIHDFPFIDSDGSRLIMEVGLDITERKKAAEKVLAERQRLFDVLETLPTMICLLTPDYKVAFANHGFRERFGESHGRHCYDYCFGKTAPCEFCESYRVLETGRPHHWEVKSPDGSVIDAYDFPFTDVDGSPLILEMDIDITDQRRSEQELLQAHEELGARATQLRALAGELTLSEQRERSRLAKVLHDHLQQLLVAAKFRTAVVSRGGDDVLKKATNEIEELIDEAIGASRSLTAELSPPILQEAGLNAGLEWLARRMANKQGLFVDLEMEEVGALPDNAKVLLFESVRELLFNVVKHAHTASATVNMRRVDGHLQITVSDEGAGFDLSTMKAPGEEGRGFGLFSIRERLELMGGKLQVESTPGQGSRFIVMFPIEMSTTSEPEPAQTAPPPTQPVPAYPDLSHKIRVLIADDHAVVRQGIANLLSDQPDIEVVAQAADGQEAVEWAAKLIPDVILMDIGMPKLNGVEATRSIHHDHSQIRIIGLSMFEEAERAQAMRDAGAVDYLTKSGPAEVLINAIRASIKSEGAVPSAKSPD
jgi:PAS domain S-box-containing protein